MIYYLIKGGLFESYYNFSFFIQNILSIIFFLLILQTIIKKQQRYIYGYITKIHKYYLYIIKMKSNYLNDEILQSILKELKKQPTADRIGGVSQRYSDD